jgi:uncharacterized phage-associated protein
VKPIKFTLNERKALQAAGRLITQAGGEMNYLALMKLLYLIDREALIRFGRPITGDKVVAMKHGPVLGRIYDLVSHKKQRLPTSDWHKFIPRPGAYVCTLRFAGVPDSSALSEAETALIDDVLAAHRGKSEWELVEFTCSLPEWRDPKTTSVPIAFEDILRAAKIPKAEVEAIAEEAAADLFLDEALASVRSTPVNTRGRREVRCRRLTRRRVETRRYLSGRARGSRR